jgi:hypothetical protein
VQRRRLDLSVNGIDFPGLQLCIVRRGFQVSGVCLSEGHASNNREQERAKNDGVEIQRKYRNKWIGSD